ncbi:MAG: hypothetical protein RIQ93_2169 [Verrucomicrobiota bacterium]|jgi:tetratricopeptide (TPR) repeat protein
MLSSVILGLLLLAATPGAAALPDRDSTLAAAQAAEESLNSRKALELYLAADRAQPNDPRILQKIARQYSDLVDEQTGDDERRRYARMALDYSRRAVALDPSKAENVLSLAISHGKLAVHSDLKTRIKYSRLVKEEAERALALDPRYAWAHHVLGRWHHEVATLGGAARAFLRLFYGGLPPASTAFAVQALQQAVELEPDELAHQLELGFAFAADGQTARARAQFEKGLALPSRRKHDELAKARARAALDRLW